MKTDHELQRDVLEELSWEPSVDAAEIGVTAKDGVVVLNGTVRSLNEKWVAERVAQRINGVRAVTDELVVKLAGDTKYGDAEIAAAVVNALDWSWAVPSKQIKVLVDKGWVTLEGSVEHKYQQEAADDLVRGLRGVRGISSQITVKPHVKPENVTQAIKKALHRAAQVDAEMIRVETKDSQVILRGSVKTWAEREEAERAAWAAPGVSFVQNEIRVAEATAA